jgi:hypothetical protein
MHRYQVPDTHDAPEELRKFNSKVTPPRKDIRGEINS